ncbi:ATPase, partial [Halorubrum distributum]
AGGDGDSGHAYSRHRPIRRAGLIRHAGRGSYAYAVPDLVREAYADRLDEDQVDEIVRAVERVFVPPAELHYPPDADPADVEGEAGTEADDRTALEGADGATTEGDEAAAEREGDSASAEAEESAEAGETGEAEPPTDPGLSDAARRFAERSER